jgi:MFS family permease
LRRNLSLDVLSSVGVGVMLAMTVSLLPSAARQAGMAPIVLALLAAVPYIANLLSAFGSRLGAHSTRQLGLMRVIGAAMILLVAFLPSAPVVVLAVFVFWLSLALGGPFHVRVWGSIYPAHARGRILGLFGSARSAALATAAFVGGMLADQIGGFTAIAVITTIGVVASTGYFGLRSSTTPELPAYTARSSFSTLLGKPVLRRVVIAHGFYGAGIVAAVPLFAMVHVDRLHLSMGEVGVIGVIGAIVTTVTYPLWGVMVDRVGSLAALRLGTMLGLAALVGYLVAPSVAFLWVAAAAMGAAGAATDTAIVAILSEETTLEERGAALAGWNGTTGVWGIAAPLTMSLVLGLGLITVSQGLAIASFLSLIGVGLYLATDRRTAIVRRAVTDSRMAHGVRSVRNLALGR